MISKKLLLVASGIVSVSTIIVGSTGLTYDYCPSINIPCTDLVYDAIVNLLIFIPLFLFSLITYKMRDEVYRAWLRFAYVWVPFSIVLIFLSPQYSTDWMYPVEKGTVAFLTSALFATISLILIVWKSVAIRRAS